MGLVQLLVFVVIALGTALLPRGRGWCMLIASILAIYWLQPPMPIRNLDFWLPTISLGLISLTWVVTRQLESTNLRHDLTTALVVIGLLLGIGLTRYLGPVCCLTPTRPPTLWQIALVIFISILLTALILHFMPGKVWLASLMIFLILGLFIILKTIPLTRAMSVGLRTLTGQSSSLASALDIRWLGFSYIAFRLIHVLRDRLAGRLPELSLQELVIYTIFFPAITAGPIDRVQRFSQDLHKPFSLSTGDFWDGGQRIVWGIFKKFALADTLALIALNPINSLQSRSHGWTWILVYAYAFRIYFDFSGYTDIAIGLGRWMGFKLPENFEHPYIKPNLTLFWNSWHMTLAQWFRAYIFNPLTRLLRTRSRSIPIGVIIFIGQISTMLLIGLWHGVTWNFALWGFWHGLGLFIHNRWSDATKAHFTGLERNPRLYKLLSIGGTLLTFHYVLLGWVWFALPSINSSWNVFMKLFGR
jgi:alginate O-acetyltransferase complex protein AlgI